MHLQASGFAHVSGTTAKASPSTNRHHFTGAGIDSFESGSANNRTLWPISGGSLKIEFHHQWTYVFINLGIGNNVTNFNISLTPLPLNQTGNGTLCVEKFVIPSGVLSGVQDGTNASLQISTVGDEGNALYNVSNYFHLSVEKSSFDFST
jgi:hypothetical protein